MRNNRKNFGRRCEEVLVRGEKGQGPTARVALLMEAIRLGKLSRSTAPSFDGPNDPRERQVNQSVCSGIEKLDSTMGTSIQGLAHGRQRKELPNTTQHIQQWSEQEPRPYTTTKDLTLKSPSSCETSDAGYNGDLRRALLLGGV